jgi:photosystem II stability/assembly factor-like uncharacterized protein
VLGTYLCGAPQCIALVRSTDAGKQFFRVALPPLPTEGNVPSVDFVNSRVGYLFVAGGPLYVTRDGGSTWRFWGPKHVLEVTAGDGEVYAAWRNHLHRSPISRSSWHAVALPTHFRFLDSLAVRGRKVWLLVSTRNIRADVTLRSGNRGATFRKTRGPCIPDLGGALVPVGRGVVWALCPTGMMAGLSLSTNGGRTFPRYRSFHDPGGTSLPSLTNGAAIFTSSPRDAVVYRGARGPLYRTTDMGRRWTSVRGTGRFEQLFWLHFATSKVGTGLFTTKRHPERGSLWRTTDGGATWHFMPIR